MLRVWLLLSLLLGSTALAAQPVRYCDHPVYPPISWSDGKHMRGLAPRVVSAVMASLGQEVELVTLGNWKRCLLDAAEGRVDVVLAYRTQPRQDFLRFASVPVLREEVAIFYNRRRPLKVDVLEDLTRYRGGLLFGESYWRQIVDFEAMVENGVVDEADVALIRFVETAEEAWQVIDAHYGEAPEAEDSATGQPAPE